MAANAAVHRWIAVLALLSGSSAAASASQDLGRSYDARADVVAVTPRYVWEDVRTPMLERGPVRSCRGSARPRRPLPPPDYHDHHDHGYAGPDGTLAGIIGGVIGGVIGHQFGGGRGKTALTFAGAALGASVARDRVRRGWREPAGRCAAATEVRRIRRTDGYDVTYRYHGRTFHKIVAEPPGDSVAVRVEVEPLEAQP